MYPALIDSRAEIGERVPQTPLKPKELSTKEQIGQVSELIGESLKTVIA